MKLFSLPKKERIKGNTLPTLLYQEGTVFFEHPVLCKVFCKEASSGGFQILIGVPKRKIKKAIDRNKLKRRMREAWRLNCEPLRSIVASSNNTMLIGLYYQSSTPESYKTIESKIKKLIRRLIKYHEETHC